MRPVWFKEQVFQDLLEIYEWYENEQPGLSLKFEERFDTAINFLETNPSAYQTTKRGFRAAQLKQFPYRIFYKGVRN
ncbi:MAG: type II toxin-antitoxin system RelE/ParE family toxin [Cyclobacteriaceae bacterium]|nr:type II toxin-antitoxin system RelE/ParE family toxin [Cyclobacteriaceae bacterium]